MKSIFMTTVALGVLFAVSACNKSSGDSATQVENRAAADGNRAVQKANYVSDCSASSTDIGGLTLTGVATEYDLSDLNFTKKTVYFSDTCQSPVLTISEKGQVKVIGGSSAAPNALDEDFTFQATTLTLVDEPTAQLFNTAKVCGFNDWSANVEKDISAAVATDSCPGKVTPRIVQEIVLIESGTSLYLGANTENVVRPTTFDRSLIFKKK